MAIKSRLLGAAALLALAFTTGAQAAAVTKTYAFTLSDFIDPASLAPPPVTAVTASFTVTFDPALSYTDDTTDITENTLNVPVTGAIAFSAGPAGGTPYFMSIGGLLTGPGLIAPGTNDFVLQLRFDDPTNLDAPSLPKCSDPGFTCGGSPAFFASGYTRADSPASFWVAQTASVVAVPEPAAWALMLVGFGGLGAALRRRKRAQTA